MMKNKKLILVISLVTLVVLAFLVSAAISTINPLDGTNHSSASLVLFNVTFVNGTDLNISGTSQTNVNSTFFRVSGSTRTFLTNSSQCSINSAGTTVSCWTTFNVSGADGFFNITSTVYNSTAQVNSSVNITSVYFDSTPPAVSADNFVSFASGGNYSQNLKLNISITDATIGVQTVFFNITNATSGLQNATVTATLETGTSRYSTTINTTGYPDGYYNLTVYANDTLNNLNRTTTIQRFIFDNTLPTASFTCEDLTVEEDEVMDCDCTGTDSLSNISSIDFDPTPPTSTIGTNLQSNCTVTDRAGNIRISSILYDVSEVSGTTSGGSSGGSSGTTTSGTTTSSSGTNSSTNNSIQNASSGANQLEGNQQNQNEGSFKINYWILGAIIIGAGLVVATIILLKKGILQRLLKFNK